jgi:hypothetical protein
VKKGLVWNIIMAKESGKHKKPFIMAKKQRLAPIDLANIKKSQ